MRLLSLVVLGLVGVFVHPPTAHGQAVADPVKYIREHYTRQDYRIPMRDGTRLYTVVYAPKDSKGKYPFLMMRTPYGVGPYEQDKVRGSLGPNPLFLQEGYIFVYQDVRGCFMSEGEFENMRPHRRIRHGPRDIDESTDTYDTIEWLVKNVPNNNGKAGQYGISYPGFYSSAGMIDAHPALKAVSPQAPIADWFFDDFFHHGAFFLNHAFNFFSRFGHPRPVPTPKRGFSFDHGTPDGYQFFLDIGPLGNVNPKHYKNRIAFWQRFVEHPNYDTFWQERNLLPHLRQVAPAVMTVGGWFDAEDLYGPLQTYRAVEKQNPGIFNVLVMGPWAHGAWARKDSSKLGNIHFGANPSVIYHKDIELAFFNHFLKGKGENRLPEAYVFETGKNRWRQFSQWPPPVTLKKLYLREKGSLGFEPPSQETEAYDAFPSDPHRPVPFTEAVTNRMSYDYMTDDQRFASRRPDVLVYQTEPLTADVTLAGPIQAHLWVSTTGTDADWIVKVIDVFPGNYKEKSAPAGSRSLGGYQMHVRSEVLRGRFRNSYSKPEPFVPNQATRVVVPLQDVFHTFRKGHRILVQVHSTWFPLVDRNPQKFVDNIFLAREEDFIKTTHRVYRAGKQGSYLEVGVSNHPAATQEHPWGDVKGRVVWDARENLPTEGWIINAKNQGIKNVFVWLAEPAEPRGIKELPTHPELRKIKVKEIQIDIPAKARQFVPQAVGVREGQVLIVKNSTNDTLAFRYHTVENAPGFTFLPPNRSLRINLKAQPMPIFATCWGHRQMRAWVRVFSHPYFAVTDENGAFEFKNAPAGKYRLMIWHASAGWKGGAAGKDGDSVEIRSAALNDQGAIVFPAPKP